MAPTPASRSTTEMRQQAFRLIRELSFRTGDFTLSSGEKSRYYLDMKPTMFHPDGVRALAQLVLARLENVKVDWIGGLELGAVPLIAPVVMLANDQHRFIPGFFVRKQPKSHGTMKLVEAPEGALRGKNVVILEDVTTKGDSALRAVRAAEEAGARVALVLSIVDREAGAAALFKQNGIEFDSLFKVSAFLAA